MANTPRKTYPELTAAIDVQNADILASWRSSGPLKKLTAQTLANYTSAAAAAYTAAAEAARDAAQADAVATAADRVQTGLDRVQTGLDAASATASAASTAAVQIFPGRFVGGILPSETAALPRVLRLTMYDADPSKYYNIKQLFWKDFGTRFGIILTESTDNSGTGATDVCGYSVSSGANVWTGLRELTLTETGSSGVSATVVIDFTDTTLMDMYSPTDAATYQRRQINPSCLDAGVARTASLNADILAGVSPLLPSAVGQRRPFLDTNDATGSIFSNELLRGFIKNVWVYGPDQTSNIRIEYMRLSEAATSFIHLYDEDRGRRICTWAETGTSSFASKPRYVAARDIPDLLVYSGDWAVLELDWSVLTANIEGPLSNMTQSGLYADCLHSWEDSTWWAENPVFHQTVPVGPTRTYTTLALAIAGLDRPSHPNYAILLKLDEAATDYEADGLVLPQFVSIQGPGMHAVAGISNADTASTYPVIERHTSSHIWDVRVQSNTGDGTAGSGEYCIHHDPVRADSWGSAGGGQRWGVMGSMRNVLLVGSANNDANLFGGGFNSGMIEIWDNVKSKRLKINPTSADFSAHDTAPEPTSGGIYAPNSQQLKPITWRVRDSSSPSMTGSGLQIISLNSGALTTAVCKNQLVLSGCSFRLVTQTVTVGTAFRWEMSGTHSGAVVQTVGVGGVYPDMGTLRALRNTTGVSIPTGRAVKFGSGDTITLCGAGERIDGWTTAAIANGATGFVNIGKSISTQYLDGATASTGDWGLNASGQIDYTASVKLGRTSGSVVDIW